MIKLRIWHGQFNDTSYDSNDKGNDSENNAR